MDEKNLQQFWLTTDHFSADGEENLRNNERWAFCKEFNCFLKKIPFECETVPDDYEFMFVSNKRNLMDLLDGIQGVSLIVREIMKGNTKNRYAYFGKKFNTLSLKIDGI